MELTDYERDLLNGRYGRARQAAIKQQIDVGRFFDAQDFVEIAQVHIMADGEALGAAGVRFLESLSEENSPSDIRLAVPTITDPRGTDLKAYRRLRQAQDDVDLEVRAMRAFERLGVMLTNTCINYQTVMPPARGQHLAFGDTGSVIYANSVCGARSNFEGGPSALAAALTGRTPRYGFHLNAVRAGDTRVVVEHQPSDLAEWGALGGLIGGRLRSYFETPVVEGIEGVPSSDELKHFGAAMASYGSTPMFHMVGVTPEAPDAKTAFQGTVPEPAIAVDKAMVEEFQARYRPKPGAVDVVVFAAPQLSLFELRTLAELLQGRRVAGTVSLLAAVPPQVKADADRIGLTATIEEAGGVVLEGVCFYQMRARELAEANGWQRLMSNSAKLVNILGGYGYEPVLASMEQCVDAAVAGQVVQ